MTSSYYLRSTDKKVMETVERLWKEYDALRDRIAAWSSERGFDSYFPTGFAGVEGVAGLPGKPEGFGQWTKPDSRGCSHPFKSNKPERHAMGQLKMKWEIPGLPAYMESETMPDGRRYLMYPKAIVANGAAYIEYSHTPEKGNEHRGENRINKELWHECLASEYHLGYEAWRAMRKAMDDKETADVGS